MRALGELPIASITGSHEGRGLIKQPEVGEARQV